MKKQSRMPLEDHLKTAEDLRLARRHLHRAFLRVQKHYPNSSLVMKAFHKMLMSVGSSPWLKLKNCLDEDYFQATTQEQRMEYGWIYYLGEDEPIKQAVNE